MKAEMKDERVLTVDATGTLQGRSAGDCRADLRGNNSLNRVLERLPAGGGRGKDSTRFNSSVTA